MTSQTSENTKRIAKNTVFLYIRMLLGLIISLFTARLILQALGIEDYGLNNVVGGVISLFAIVTGVLNSATSRFLTVELGKGNLIQMRRVYKNSMSLYIILAIIIVILEETIGLYLVNYTLSIPDERLFACNVLYQTIVLSSMFTLFLIPSSSLIIAFEKMDVYAYIGIGEIIAKCLVVYWVMVSPIDKLISLACLNLIVIGILSVIKLVYCKRSFSNVFTYKLGWNKFLLRSMLGFSFWNLIGSAAYILRIQGVNILINIYFGAIVNAANAIAYQVNAAVNGFVTNFSTAVNPQITKTCAAGQYEQMKSLIFRSGKFTFYLLMFLCFPILFETDFVLNLWLGDNIPEYTVIMTRLVLVISMVETFTYSIGCAVNATGKVKYYQIVICSIMLLIFPIAWLMFKFGLPPYYGLIVYMFTSITALLARFYFMEKLLNISSWEYTKMVYSKTILVSIVSAFFPLLICYTMDDGWIRFIIVCLTVELVNVLVIWIVGLDRTEKTFMLSVVNKIFKRK